jgi:hypothetical protein
MIRSRLIDRIWLSVRVQEHPDLSKADKKRLCQLIDCRKLSPEVRA